MTTGFARSVSRRPTSATSSRPATTIPGFVVDGRKVTLVAASGCRPYGVPAGCPRGEIGRYRKTPSWLDAGKPLGLTCRIADRTESCAAPEKLVTVEVGGMCDTQMRPVSGVH